MKTAIIGCGYVFDHYMATLARHPILEITGVADRDPARTEAVARVYGMKVYPSAEAIFADPEVELVLNLTSIDSHAEIIRAALEAGKHVYTEKPVTEDPEEVQALFALAEEKGLTLSAAPCNILSDMVATMRRAVADGIVGSSMPSSTTTRSTSCIPRNGARAPARPGRGSTNTSMAAPWNMRAIT